MKTKEDKYYFGRFNILGQLGNKKEFIFKGLKTKKTTLKRSYSWGFFEIAEIKIDKDNFITGYLVKYKPITETEIVKEETHSLAEKNASNLVIAKSRFFLHIESNLIAYRATVKVISAKQFRESFVELFNSAYDDFFVDTEIQTIEEQFEILESIKEFSSISHVSIYLHPSNPRNTDRWKRVDERLKTLNVRSYKEEYDFNPNSKHIGNDEEALSKIAMADDGYGKADITGVRDGETKTISTTDNPITTIAPSDTETPEEILESLITTFKKILARFEK